VFINSSGQHQERLAPLIVALLTEIKEARYQLHRKLKAAGGYRPPTVLALDETGNIAPIPDLPSVVGQGGSQGVVGLAVFQHLGQAKARWGADGEGFLTTFQERLIFPGIWQNETLEAISAVIGDWDRPVTSMTQDAHSTDPRKQSWTHSTHRERILPASDIRMGQRDWPEAALFLQGRRHRWIHTTRYYNHQPWPHMLITAMERWAQAPERYPQRQLPIPDLTQANPDTGEYWLWEAGGDQLCNR
jgi:type IV secretory pathway TraG/TraD family ATPase VirD4